jgi:hypothetical protein
MVTDGEGGIESVPVIYTRAEGAAPLKVSSRAIAGIVALGCLAVLVIAAWLRPDHGGTGTHRQMGFAACEFKARTGLPCPSCGFTTAFSYFAHGNFVASVYTQPMGALLAWVTAITVWVGLYIAVTGRPVHRLLTLLPGRYYLMPLLLFALLAWGFKIMLTLTKHDGWN